APCRPRWWSRGAGCGGSGTSRAPLPTGLVDPRHHVLEDGQVEVFDVLRREVEGLAEVGGVVADPLPEGAFPGAESVTSMARRSRSSRSSRVTAIPARCSAIHTTVWKPCAVERRKKSRYSPPAFSSAFASRIGRVSGTSSHSG